MFDEKLGALLFQRRAPGRVVWIGRRPDRRLPMEALTEATLIEQRGLLGDYTAERGRGGGKRQLSLIQAEHLPVIASWTGHERVLPQQLRRNVVVAGINLLALRSTRFRIGGVLLEGTGTCDPCRKMEVELGVGGYNAMRGHGGILARILSGGTIALEDEVDFAPEAEHAVPAP